MTAIPIATRTSHFRCARGRVWMWTLLAFTLSSLTFTVAAAAALAATAAKALPLRVVTDGIPEPLDGAVGDALRGRALLVARESANCVLCHAMPQGVVRFSGDVGPSLAGIGTRLTAAQLRLRVADIPLIHPQTIMPSYYRIDGLNLVASAYAGKPILTAQELEDVVAYLGTLR